MAVRFTRSGTGVVKDHNDLVNRGIRTHEEIDAYLDEIDSARGDFASLNERLNYIMNHIGEYNPPPTGNIPGGGGSCVGNYLYEVYACEEDGIKNLRLSEGRFQKGLSELEVFRGGRRLSIGDEYLEIDDQEISFIDPLNKSEIVVLRVRDRLGLLHPLGFHEEYFIVNNDTTKDFMVSYNFDKLGKYLEVYLNGLLMSVGKDFTLLSLNGVRFNYPVPKGSLVYFRIADKSINELPRLLQEKIVTTNELEYKLETFTYRPNKNELEIYLGGIRQVKGIDYVEVSEDTFKFLHPIPENILILACKENSGAVRLHHIHYYEVEPIGEVDGLNKEFLLPHIPQEGTLIVYVGGIRQKSSYYTLKGNSFELIIPPPKGVDLSVDYIV